MSRSAEEQLLLDQKIQAMKQKNEELRRRHREVEADKQIAAKQNALVKMNVPLDDDWVPGRHDYSPRQDRSHQQNSPSSPSNPERHDDKGQWSDQRHRNEGYSNRQFDEGASNPRHMQNTPNYSGRRSDYQCNRQKPDSERTFGNENRRSGDWPNRSNDGSGGRTREWGPQSNRGYRNIAPSGSGDASRGFTSKVYKNSCMDPDRGKRPAYRLAEGDGPPPDPSYSFLGDSMRDSPESTDRRRGQPRGRGFPRGQGRGGQAWNNRGFNDSSNGEDRGEMQPRHHVDTKHDEWRRERSKIDQERINRQKTSDGNWSREWDNNKVLQEGTDRPNRWRRGNQTQNYAYSQPRRGYNEDAGNMSRHNYVPKTDSSANPPSTGNTSDEAHSPMRNKFPRRGRFTHQQRFKDNPRFSNGSVQNTNSNEPAVSKESEDAALIETTVKTVEQLQISLVSNPSGTPLKRNVEGVGGALRLSVSNDGECSDGKNVEQKRVRKNTRKAKRNRILSSTSTGTTETAEEDDGSWEDLSSEDDVSVLTELHNVPRSCDMAKCGDVSSGPESLDPIPAPGKEDEFLWDDFHPAGFQDNVTLNLEAEAAYQALLDEKAKQVADSQDIAGNISAQQQAVSFKLDTACLEDSGDELEGVKLDPLLITTQIVQAEVDCMSLTSIPTDTSLSDEVSQFSKVKAVKDNKILEEEVAPKCAAIHVQENTVSAEELSGPVSILDVPSSTVPTEGSKPVDMPIQSEEHYTKHLEAINENSGGQLEAAASSSSESKADADSVRHEGEEEVKEVIDSLNMAPCENESPKEVLSSSSDEREKSSDTEEVVTKADPPNETQSVGKSVESKPDNANSIPDANKYDPSDNIPVGPSPVSHINESELVKDETLKSPQVSETAEDANQIKPTKSTQSQQEKESGNQSSGDVRQIEAANTAKIEEETENNPLISEDVKQIEATNSPQIEEEEKKNPQSSEDVKQIDTINSAHGQKIQEETEKNSHNSKDVKEIEYTNSTHEVDICKQDSSSEETPKTREEVSMQ